MKKNSRLIGKKIPAIIGFAAFSMLVAQSTLAQDLAERPERAHPGQQGVNQIVQAIDNLRDTTVSMALATQRTANLIANAIDKEFSNLIQINTESSAANQQGEAQVIQNNLDEVHNQLAQFPNETITYSSTTNPTVQQSQNEKLIQDNLINSLTLGVNMSDTLYSAVNNIESATYYTTYPQSKPDKYYDNYLDFSSLYSPDSYNQDQQQAAQYFINYLTKSYQSQTDGINLDQFQNYLSQFTNDPVTLGEKLQALKSNPTYQQFQINVRSNMAAKSVTMDTLNQLLVERTPLQSQGQDPDPKLESISKLVGVDPQQIEIPDPNNPTQKIKVWTYVSPLQINNYMANHRINDPNWYQEVASASTESLLRKMVVIMAESESLTQQNHLDNERIQAALATLNMQSASLNQAMGRGQLQDINNTIANITGSTPPTTPPPPPTGATTESTTPPTGTTPTNTIPTS